MNEQRQMLRTQQSSGLLSPEQENTATRKLVRMLPPQRMLKMFGMLRKERVNNARTRRLILLTLLSAENLEYWCVKYRRKVANALVHVWGRRTASILRAVLTKSAGDRSQKERQIVQRNLHRCTDSNNADRVEQCVRFVLGDEDGLTLRRLAAYRDAKTNLAKGDVLPFETLVALRKSFGRYVGWVLIRRSISFRRSLQQRLMAFVRSAKWCRGFLSANLRRSDWVC
ncbi:MAG: hypothetical protein P8J37_10105 [Fuerstiella sp.]|nr:hypothetical protein [Fuerstiella sp.]